MKAHLATKVLNFVSVSSALTKRALDEVQTHRQVREKAAALRPTILQRMVETGTVAENQKQAAEAMLASHPETLGLLQNAVEKIAELRGQIQKQASDLGQGVDPREAGTQKASSAEYDSLTSPFVGRRTSQKKASDMAILSVLNR